VELEVVVAPGLGDNSYLVASGSEAAVVDPQRDVGRLLSLAESRDVTISHIVETHVHNDYVSGAIELREATGAEILAPARGRYEFAHRRMAEGDEARVGELRLVAIETPGHTPEHLSYLVYERTDVPVAAFTGGSLMVGGAGRTDLLGPEQTEELTRAQYRTLRRLASLPDTVQVLPTHGAGSFCGAGPARKQRISTMLEERGHNRALASSDEEEFVRQQLSGLLDYPAYYAHMASINRAGPPLVRDVPPAGALSPEEVEARVADGAWVVDGRGRRAFAEAHLPGSINVELTDSFASYVGWVVPFNHRLVLVLPPPEETHLDEAVAKLLAVGYERIEGYLAGGLQAWRSSGRQVRSFPVATIEELCEEWTRSPSVLDVRQREEWYAGHIPRSTHIFVGDLPHRLDEVPRDREVWVACATGQRTAIAASLLDRRGVSVRSVVAGGIPDWLRLCPPEGPSAEPALR
jgi:hydroxyacylglutathione hydrolase